VAAWGAGLPEAAYRALGRITGKAHRHCVERIGVGGELWLRTKPFSVPPGYFEARMEYPPKNMVIAMNPAPTEIAGDAGSPPLVCLAPKRPVAACA
jgi:hypothetical protein